VITEDRITEQEFLGENTIEHVLYARPDLQSLLALSQYDSQQAAIAAWFQLFFPGETQPTDPDDGEWRKKLGGLLKKHLLFVNLLKLAKSQIISLADLQQQMQGPLPENARQQIGPVLDALLALVAWARDLHGRPFLTLRVQLWMRELRRMVASVRLQPEQIHLRSANDLRREPGKLNLPLIQCTDCHCTGWLSRLPEGQAVVSQDLDEIYNSWFAGQPQILRLYANKGLSRPQCEGVVQHLCTACGNLQTNSGDCSGCGHSEMMEVFRITGTRITSTRSNADRPPITKHDFTCPACGSWNSQMLLGARNATLGAIVIEQTWGSPYNDDKKLIAFSDSVQDAAHRAGFFTARTYLNTVRTGLARVIDHVAAPQCAWPDFLEQAGALWREPGSSFELAVEQFISEFIGPNMLWQRDWAEHLLKEGRLPASSRLPGRVQKRLAWQAFAEFTYLSRRGRNLETLGKAVLMPKIESIQLAAQIVLPVLQESFGIRHLNEKTVFQWLWGFVCQLKFRGAVTHPEMATFMKDGSVFAFAQTGGRREWLPGIGTRSAQPRFLSLGSQEHLDRIVGQGRSKTIYQTWMEATLGANGLLPEGADHEIYLTAVQALETQRVIKQAEGKNADVVGLNAAEMLLETRVVRLLSAQGKRTLAVPEAIADALLGMPCLHAPQEVYAEKIEGATWFACQFSRADLRRVFSAEHTGMLDRQQREALEQRFKDKQPQPWFENLLSATPTLEMGVDIGDLSSVMLCSVPPNQASYLQRIGRAGRRDGNAFTSTLADGVSPHDLYFFEDTQEMLSGEVTPPGIFLKAPEVLRRQLFAFCLDHWVGSGIKETALPDKTKEALDARDSHDQTRFPYTFLSYIFEHEDALLSEFKSLLGSDLDERVSERLEKFMKGTDQDDALRIRLSKLLDELSKERASHKTRAEDLKKRIKALKALPQDDAVRGDVELITRERLKALEIIREINQRDLLNTLTDSGLIPNYAFPEAGVELKSLLWRKKSSDDPDDAGAYISLPAERYERPAHSALSEFAPENVFYANQRRVEVDQINMELSTLETWRLCPTCHHMRNLEIHADAEGACPKCGDPMWANVSQKRQLLRFKQAIANSDDTKVRIDDSAEDREPKFYVRQMMTDFDPSDVREAYQLKASDTPFGFEFIDRVVFRDVNFGEPTKPGEAYAVAGQQRARPGFKLCKHCGQVQRPPRNDKERSKPQLHAFDCSQRESDDPDTLVDCLYLYREFASEALRILVPFTKSGVDEMSVQSFMAALQIGLKRRFGGKVDHLRMVTQEVKDPDGGASQHYVLLYDSVPGGTGYLHELLADGAKTLASLLKMALQHVRECSCNSDPEKDGCYRCVFQHRLGKAMELVSRDRARAILEELVTNLDHLEKVSSISDIFVNPNFDSELEAKFIESLRRIGGKGGLPFVRLVQDLVQGKSGYLLEAGDQRYWVEPQVELQHKDGVKVPSKPDFVLWPAQGRSGRKPIAVFCDGWAYHQTITQADAAKRNALVASGKFWVWAVTWDDVIAAMEGKLETTLQDSFEAMAISPLPPVLAAMVEPPMWSYNGVAALVRWLSTPPGVSADAYAHRMAYHAGATLFRLLPHPTKPELSEARHQLTQFWNPLDELPCERPDQSSAAGNVNEDLVTIRYWWPYALQNKSDKLPLSLGFVTYNERATESEPERHYGWQRWLWLFNTLQTLPGMFLATRNGLESADHHSITFSQGGSPASGGGQVAHASGWDEVISQTMESLSAGLLVMKEEGLPIPDEVGFELAENGDVIAECELAWTQPKLVLLMHHHFDFQATWTSQGLDRRHHR
jgi:DEAD/DEAH box helicase domain-containing protein